MTLRLRHSYQPQHKPGSARNASAVASFDASKFSQRPVSASLKVGIPLSADAPAPVNHDVFGYPKVLCNCGNGHRCFPQLFCRGPVLLRGRRTLFGHWTCRSADGCRKPSHSVSRPGGIPSSRLRPVACALRLLFYALDRMTPVQHSMK